MIHSMTRMTHEDKMPPKDENSRTVKELYRSEA